MNDISLRHPAVGQTNPPWLEWALQRPGRSHFIHANGARLHFLSWNFEATDKPTLLFVHGFRGHAHWWDFIAPFFSADFRVVALDLSGMGDSEHREQYESATLARDVAAVAELLGPAPVIAIGHSYGGSRVLRACAERPELFARLLIIDSYVIFEGEPPPQEPPRIRGDREYPDQASALARFRLLPTQPDSLPCLVRHVAEHSLCWTRTGVRWKFDSNLPPGGARETDGGQMLGRVTCPVDYLCGEASVVVSAERARRIVDALPRGNGPIVIPSGHHHLMFDQPIALISTLRALLASSVKT